MSETEFSPPHPENQKPKAGILPEKYTDLHTSKEVSFAISSARAQGERVPNEPQEKVSRYLGSLLNANYPARFRYYTIRSVLTLGTYNKERHEFSKRSKSTVAPFVDLNREALAYVYDTLNQTHDGKPIQEEQADEKLASLLKSKNFGKLYAYAVEKATPASPDLRREIRGEWVKYDRIEDTEEGHKRARTLSDSLQGHGTGWCTPGHRPDAGRRNRWP
jgi:hypothetical protein